MRIRAAIAISVALHGTVLAWVQIHKSEPLPVVAAPTPPITITPVEVEPLAVALLDDHTVAAIPAAAPPSVATTVAAHAGTHRISTGRTGATTEPETKAEPGAKPHSGLMTMRKPEPPELKGPSDAFWAQFEANTKPLQPKAIEGERIEDEVADAADHLRNPRWLANHSPEQVTDERLRLVASREARANHELQHNGAGFEADHATFTGKVEADGTAHIDEKRSYDPTEILMRKYGNDPYAANKLRMLDRTRDERYEIGKQYKERQLAKSAVLAQSNLGYLWAHATSTVERKRALFEMWDECAETGTAELIAGGTAARKMIVGFIRGHLTGDAAYTPAELAAFNAKKKSQAAFDPYAD
ncbi:MAG: hypothetical protein ABJE66_10370 [Deltaproteobacteria bacterium]